MTTTERPLRADAARNREQILAAARQVFAEEGLGASVEEIARVAGVGMGTLYRRFPTKEDLVDELVQSTLHRFALLAEQARAQPDGNGLEGFLRAASALQADNRGCLPRLWAGSADNELVAAARRSIAALLVQAKAYGRVRQEVTGTDVTVILWSLRGVIESSGATALTVWKRHLELIIAGLRPSVKPLRSSALSRVQLNHLLGAAPDQEAVEGRDSSR